MFLSSLASFWPEKPGIYIFRDSQNKILYVGKAINLKKRVSSYFFTPAQAGVKKDGRPRCDAVGGRHFQNQDWGEKTQRLILQVKKIEHIIVESEIEALILEANLIKKYQPKFNVNLKDGKAYPFIKITTSEKFPRITTARRVENQKETFYGPYPDSKTLYSILKLIRKVFPYRSCRRIPKKPCLYFHINRCPGFCLNRCLSLQQDYRKSIRMITLFLEGKSDRVLKILDLEMSREAKRGNYEEAKKAKDQIERMKLLLRPIHRPFEYLENPNLLSDIRAGEVKELYQLLKKYFPSLSSNFFLSTSRIECFDISNISGKDASGSMVVFMNGEAEKSTYRRFKIKTVTTPDDPLMITEVLNRRFKHPEWPYPNLIVVDGGVTQVRAINLILTKNKLRIPVIGLAKRFEQIFFADGQSLSLSANSPVLHLLARLRDEAHRFAVLYHRKLRKKMLL